MSEARPSILLIGSIHTAAAATDGEPWIVRHQDEVVNLVENLARFEPTIVALEILPEHHVAVQEKYERFVSDGVVLGTSEGAQIGFRLARRRGLDRVHGFDADWYLEWGGLRAAYPGEAELAAAMSACVGDAGDVFAHTDELLAADASVLDVLRWVNCPEYAAADHSYYVRVAELGTESNNAGAEYTASWYLRNLRMYANLCRLAAPEDRVFALVGSGHAPILRHLIRHGGRFDVHDPVDYLVADPSR